MFKKVHFRLALLCTGITGIIMVCMSLFYLLVVETNLKNNYFYTFENDVESILFQLENQSIISYEWLSRLESGGKYCIFLEDNGQPLLYGNIVENKERTKLLTNIKNKYSSFLETEADKSSSLFPFHQEFTYTGSNAFFAINKKQYHVSYGKIQKRHGYLTVYILCSLKDLYKQIYTQRALFSFINLAALISLFFFSWYFTKKLLKPIEENQKKQVQFIAAASHELRTPLTVILSSVSALKRLSIKKDAESFYQIIEGETNRMSRLVDDMLLLANDGNQSYSIHLEETDADTLLLNCYEAFEEMAKEKQIILSVSLPKTPIPLCKCDSQRIAQVLAILVHNALSYTQAKYEKDKGKGKVRLKCEYKNNHHYFSVIDNGIGIPDEEKVNIFERFYRIDNSRSKREHFGLGLCIASEIIKEHHGSILVLDTEGGGSTFIVRL